MSIVVDGKTIAQEIKTSVKHEIEQLKKEHGKTPTIATVKIGSNPESDIYLRLRDEACHKVGIQSQHVTFQNNVSKESVIKAIDELNKDKNIHGIILQFPLPDHLSQNELLSSIEPRKDVEGLTPFNMGRTLIGDEHLVPCTPRALITILEHEKTKLQGTNVVIINHSNIVGKPLAAMLLNRNATVSVCHVFTGDLKQYTLGADIVITATGIPKLIQNEHIKKDAFVIDVGIIKTKDGICGDVDFSSVEEKAGKITPVPGGVGPVTVACSLKNMVQTFKNCIDK